MVCIGNSGCTQGNGRLRNAGKHIDPLGQSGDQRRQNVGRNDTAIVGYRFRQQAVISDLRKHRIRLPGCIRLLRLKITNRHAAICLRLVKPFACFGIQCRIGTAQSLQIPGHALQHFQNRFQLLRILAGSPPFIHKLAQCNGRLVPVLRTGADHVNEGQCRIPGIRCQICRGSPDGGFLIICHGIPKIIGNRKKRIK